MHYVIDGYNLFFGTQEEALPLQKNREIFLEDLDREVNVLNMNVTIILDSHQEHAELYPRAKKLEAMEVVFSPKNLSADSYILELLSWDKQVSTLVTSDQELARRAQYLGAKTQSISKFLALLIRRRKKNRGKCERKPELRDSDANLKRLLTIFEKRLHEDENA